jgi:signal transduction histidine kinase
MSISATDGPAPPASTELVYESATTATGAEPDIPAGFFTYVTRFHLAVVVLVLAEMLRVTMGLRRRTEATWIVGIGFAGLAAVVARLLYLEQIDYSMFIGIGSLLVSMSIYLARKVGRTSKDLEIQLEQVRELSEKTPEQNRQIQEATRHKSEFLSRMSHDLRTPMNAIIGYTRILLRRAKGVLEERQFGNLEKIHTSANNLLALINEILDLSRVEAGRVEVHAQDTDLQILAEECAASVEPLVGAQVELCRQFQDVLTVRTDPEILRKILLNLLGNAVKLTEVGSITLSLRPRDDQLVLC